MTTWSAFAAAEPELAGFVAERLRATVVAAASYGPADRYVLFELRPTEVRANGYGDARCPSGDSGAPTPDLARPIAPCPAWPTHRWRHDDMATRTEAESRARPDRRPGGYGRRSSKSNRVARSGKPVSDHAYTRRARSAQNGRNSAAVSFP